MQSKNEAITVYNHAEKTALLTEQFFPAPLTDLSDIQNYIFTDKTDRQKFKIKSMIYTKDI